MRSTVLVLLAIAMFAVLVSVSADTTKATTKAKALAAKAGKDEKAGKDDKASGAKGKDDKDTKAGKNDKPAETKKNDKPAETKKNDKNAKDEKAKNAKEAPAKGDNKPADTKKNDKPAEKKNDKPAEKKNDKPAEKKNDKPAEKKSEKPAEKKSDKPTDGKNGKNDEKKPKNGEKGAKKAKGAAETVSHPCNCTDIEAMKDFDHEKYFTGIWQTTHESSIFAAHAFYGDCSHANYTSNKTHAEFTTSSIILGNRITSSKMTLSPISKGVYKWELTKSTIGNIDIYTDLKYHVLATDYVGYALVYVCGMFSITSNPENAMPAYIMLLQGRDTKKNGKNANAMTKWLNDSKKFPCFLRFNTKTEHGNCKI